MLLDTAWHKLSLIVSKATINSKDWLTVNLAVSVDSSRMNGYVFYIFIKHSIVLENKEEDGTFTTYCDLIQIGPLNMPDSNNLKK